MAYGCRPLVRFVHLPHGFLLPLFTGYRDTHTSRGAREGPAFTPWVSFACVCVCVVCVVCVCFLSWGRNTTPCVFVPGALFTRNAQDDGTGSGGSAAARVWDEVVTHDGSAESEGGGRGESSGCAKK